LSQPLDQALKAGPAVLVGSLILGLATWGFASLAVYLRTEGIHLFADLSMFFTFVCGLMTALLAVPYLLALLFVLFWRRP